VGAPNPNAGSSESGKIGYPTSPCNKSGYQTVQEDPLHQIYWKEYGSVDSEPVMFLHCGPGAGCHKFHTHFFNPERYRIILFDQRGCGKSTPSASDDDATAALTDNTTAHLIDDVLRLRCGLNIHGQDARLWRQLGKHARFGLRHRPKPCRP
jgi:proline iminopeptidase